MKFKISFKAPPPSVSSVAHRIAQAAERELPDNLDPHDIDAAVALMEKRNLLEDSFKKLTDNFVSSDDTITVEFDSEFGTATVVPKAIIKPKLHGSHKPFCGCPTCAPPKGPKVPNSADM